MDEKEMYVILEKIYNEVLYVKAEMNSLLEEYKFNSAHINYIYNRIDNIQVRVDNFAGKTENNKFKIS